jgi:hypothetical protein
VRLNRLRGPIYAGGAPPSAAGVVMGADVPPRSGAIPLFAEPL